jgi:hypothetical protein
MNLPGFDADRSLSSTTSTYQGTGFDRFPAEAGRVVSQFGISSDPDLGSYLRCRANGGSELVCRFFGGLPPFTIGRLALGR